MSSYHEALNDLQESGFTTIRTDAGDEPLQAYLQRGPEVVEEVAVERHDADGVAQIFRIVDEGVRDETALAVLYTQKGYQHETLCPPHSEDVSPRPGGASA